MSQGRSIRLFLVDGTPNGLLTAEIMNWTGHVLTGPRSKLAELVQRPECVRTGVYFLVGPDPDNNLRSKVYIGESDDVAKRLKQHNRPEASEGSAGGKDFWEKVCLVTSKDQNLTKTHVKYLESLLIGIANTVGRCELINGTAHDYGSLPESDRADMAFFLEQIRTVLPVLGFDFLRELTKPSTAVSASPATPVSHSPRFNLEVPRYGISAQGQEIDGEFFVLKGSKARAEWVGTERGYQGLFKQLVGEGVMVAQGGNNLVFSDDYAFSSPSAAAAVVCGRSANGRTSWLVEGTGQTYAAWQDQQLNSVTPEPEAE
ncbi:GIY-YIG nuclease family protein [Pseudomonas sp. RTS1]|uniref:GIY-YIG nuclease family protein n=1 Tax=unclassified Pseudomonas TaxID=196821 RepID=UPI002B237745|nr:MULTISPECIES: GIY-YIG nuclease family protein [unclassified Pseudomonas]MEA9988162.1 GIY-YIG nuclease family protein [Pseudomonas sp. RTS1]MEB0033854.1 GIY-YIG nuclease family protein [Pseudomonas sp. RTS2]MEB0234072.1 GIY-YIG nuclease family protein [Pseudomonas sp. 5S3]MEB0254813.1 GIY-YIG nuclease family protein [Pseudomonas sp. 5S2]